MKEKMAILLLFIALAMIVGAYSVSAITITVSTNVTYTVNNSHDTNTVNGVQFTPERNIVLRNITRSNIDTAPFCIVTDETGGGTTIINSTWNNNICNTNSLLLAGRTYKIGTGANATTYRQTSATGDSPVVYANVGNFTSHAGTTYYSITNITLMNDSVKIGATLSSPSNGSLILVSGRNFTANFSTEVLNFTNSTFFIWNPDSSIFNQTTLSMTGNMTNITTLFVSSFILNRNYTWNVLGCGINQTGTVCGFASSNFTFTTSPLVENYQNFTASSFETATENFSINISYNNNEYTSVSAIFRYDNTNYTTESSGTGNNKIFTANIDIPTLTTQTIRNFSWIFNLTNSTQSIYQTINSTQTVNPIFFGLCNSSLNVPYMNFTFKDETNSSNINAKVDQSTWSYYLGSGTFNDSLTFSNSSTNPSYAFCFSPQYKTLYSSLNFKYSTTGYPQRTYAPSSILTLTNTTTNQVLYLLSSADGIYSAIQVLDSTSLQGLQGAFVILERQISGSYVTIESGFSDSSGLVTFFVNPNFDYRVTATASGYVQNQVTIRPSQSTYSLTLQRLAAGNDTYTSDLEGLRWSVGPRIGTLRAGTSYTFSLNATSSKDNLENCKLDLKEGSNGTVLSTVTGVTNSTYCSIGFAYTLLPGQTVFGVVSLDTTNSSGFFIVDADAKWIGVDLNVTWSNTIVAVFDDLIDFEEFGSDSVKVEFASFVMFFFFGTLMLAILTFFTGWEVNNPLASLTIVWIMVVIGSLTGAFHFDYGSDNLSPFMERFGVGMIFTMFYFGFVITLLRREQT